MGMNVTACRSCGKPIVWIKTRAGKMMPCNVPPIRYRARPGGDTKVVTEAGDVVCCEACSDPAAATGWGYVPHWSTCDAPEKFRKGK